MERINIGGDPEFLAIFFDNGTPSFVPAASFVRGGLNSEVGVDEDGRKGEMRPKHIEDSENHILELYKNFLFEYLKASGIVKKYNALVRKSDVGLAYLTGEIEVARPLTVAGHLHIGSQDKEIQEVLAGEHRDIGKFIDSVGVEEYLNAVDDPSRLASKFGRGPDTTRQKPYGFEYRRVMGRAWMPFEVFKELWITTIVAIGNYLYNKHKKFTQNILKPYIADKVWAEMVDEKDIEKLKQKLSPLTPLIQNKTSPNILYLPIGITDDWKKENALMLFKEFMRNSNHNKHILFFGLSKRRGNVLFIHNEHNIPYKNKNIKEQAEVYIGLPPALRMGEVGGEVFRELVLKLNDIMNGKFDGGLELIVVDGCVRGFKEIKRTYSTTTTKVENYKNLDIPF